MTRYAIGDPQYGMQAVTAVTSTPGADPGPNLPHTGQQASPAPGHRTQVLMDAQSSRLRDSHMAQQLVHAARRAELERQDRARSTSPQAYLNHLLTGRA